MCSNVFFLFFLFKCVALSVSKALQCSHNDTTAVMEWLGTSISPQEMKKQAVLLMLYSRSPENKQKNSLVFLQYGFPHSLLGKVSLWKSFFRKEPKYTDRVSVIYSQTIHFLKLNSNAISWKSIKWTFRWLLINYWLRDPALYHSNIHALMPFLLF